jgi:hypothetical protein
MKNLKNLMTGFILALALVLGVGTAKAGILMTDLKAETPQPCTETKGEATKLNWGVIVQGFTGVIVQGFTGVIVQGATDTPVDCGILMTD